MTRMIKVAFLVGEFPLLSETFVISQMVGLMQRGFQVTVVCDRVAKPEGIDPTIEPFRTLLAQTHTRWWPPQLLHMVRCRLPGTIRKACERALDAMFDLRLNRFDVLIAHFGGNGLRLAHSRRLRILRRPFVTVFHGYDVALPLKQGRLARYRPLFGSGQQCLPVSDYFRRLLIAAGAKPEYTNVMRMGVDCVAIPYAPKPARDDHVRIVTVGRLVEKKGIEFAIRGLGLLAARRPDLAWAYDIIGGGPLLESLRALASECGVAARIHFLGPQPHSMVKEKLGMADAFLLPSVSAENGDMEGIPVALMEAMAAGLPVISSQHSGIPELIEDGISGLLAPERDAQGLSDKLEWLFDHPQDIPQLALAARRKVEESFNQTRLDDAMAAMLHRIVAREREG